LIKIIILEEIISIIYISSGIILHEICLRRGIGYIGRVLFCAIGFYLGPIALFLILFIKK